jgi:hypothetical protein
MKVMRLDAERAVRREAVIARERAAAVRAERRRRVVRQVRRAC